MRGLTERQGIPRRECWGLLIYPPICGYGGGAWKAGTSGPMVRCQSPSPLFPFFLKLGLHSELPTKHRFRGRIYQPALLRPNVICFWWQPTRAPSSPVIVDIKQTRINHMHGYRFLSIESFFTKRDLSQMCPGLKVWFPGMGQTAL